MRPHEQRKILVIDDDSDTCRLIERQLGKAGCMVESETDAPRGLKIAKTQPFDLILVDWTLPPELTGEALIKEIRGHETARDPSILVVTGARVDGLESACRSAGADGLLLKPFEELDLLRISERLLESPRAKPSAHKVLLVDDDPCIIDWASCMLERSGMEVMVTHNAESALKLVHEHHPELVLLDLNLNKFGLQGTDVCYEIKHDPETAATVVLMFTGVEDKFVQQLCCDEYGADGYLLKGTYKRLDLACEVRQWLKRREARADKKQLSLGPLCIDFSKAKAYHDGKPVPLTPREYDLLAFAARTYPQEATWQAIIKEIWKEECPQEVFKAPHELASCLSRVRRKLGAASRHLETVRNTGIRIVG